MKLFWQKAEVQKFEHAKDFAEEYNIGKKDFILASKSTYEAYFAALGLEAHVEYKSKYGKGEPTDEMIDALLADFRKTDCDRIIAIGGGAVIDMAKILVLAGDYSAEEIFGRKVPLKRAKTLIAVPTTCGAGSEVSNVSIAEFTKLHTKMGLAVDEIYADRAVLIPELLTGLPYSFFATSAIDAFIHAEEAYVSTAASPFSDAMAEKAMELIGGNIRRFVARRTDLEAAEAMLTGSLFAGIAFSFARLGNVHAMSHPVSAFFNVAHGVANAVLLPVIAEYNALADHGRYLKIYNYISPIPAYEDEFEPLMLVDAIRELNEDIGIPEDLTTAIRQAKKGEEISDEEIESKIDAMADDAMKSGNIAVNPRSSRKQDIVELYHKAL